MILKSVRMILYGIKRPINLLFRIIYNEVYCSLLKTTIFFKAFHKYFSIFYNAVNLTCIKILFSTIENNVVVILNR